MIAHVSEHMGWRQRKIDVAVGQHSVSALRCGMLFGLRERFHLIKIVRHLVLVLSRLAGKRDGSETCVTPVSGGF